MLDINLVTNASSNGVFDQLVKVVDAKLSEQFQKQRISNQQYGEVYVAGINAAMSQAIQFVLNAATADKQAALIDAQRLQVEAETARINKQSLQIDAEIARSNAEKARIEADTLLTQANTDKIATEKLLLQKQIDKITKDNLLTDKQILLADDQLAKSVLEKALITAKTNTEKAQYVDIIDGLAVAGIIGKQKELYQKQSEGFVRDAEQKLLKILSDVWAIQKSTDPDQVDALDTGMHDGNINVVAVKALAGIGVNPVAPPART